MALERAHAGSRQKQVESDRDRKSTRLNSSHGYISYAVFCLKKKKTTHDASLVMPSAPRHATVPLQLDPASNFVASTTTVASPAWRMAGSVVSGAATPARHVA